MRRIYYDNRLAKCLLWSGYSTAMLFGYICTKYSEPLSYRIKRHESIHAEQYGEVTMLSFLVALLGTALPLTGYYLWIKRLARR